MERKTIYALGKAVTIISLCVVSLLLLFSFIVIILDFDNTNNIIASIIFFAMWLIVILCIYKGKTVLNKIELTSSGIKLKSALGNVIKQKSWNEFTESQVSMLKGLRAGKSFICLLFNNYKVKTISYSELNKSKDVMILLYDKTSLEIIEEFVDKVTIIKL